MTISLYIKQHLITNKKYFGVTKQQNPYTYRGSGKYWMRHCEKYGWEYVITLEVFPFKNQIEATAFALMFSEYNDIVNSKEWLNLIVEDAKGGGSPKGWKHTEEWKQKMRGKPGTMNGKKHTKEAREKMSKINTGRKQTQITIQKRVAKNTGQKRTSEQRNNMSLAKKGKPGKPRTKESLEKAKQTKIRNGTWSKR